MYFYPELKGKTIMITGATGLIGQELIRTAVDNGMNVIAVIRNIEKAKQLFSNSTAISYIVVPDVSKIPIVDYELDYIIHTAANTASMAFVNTPVDIINSSVHGMERVLDIAKASAVKSFVYLSSMEIYGAQQSDDNISESHASNLDPMDVRSCYPESKRLCENMCSAYYRQYGVHAKVIRLTQTFGPGVNYNDARVFAEFARCAIEKKNIILHTKGETKRSYLYIKDAVNAIFTVMCKGKDGEAYNAANENSYCTVYDMARMVAEKCANNQINVLIEEDDSGKYGYAPVLHMNLDTSKLRSLGWTAETGLVEMFNYMIEDMKTKHAH